jgi:hypothetical protein
MAKRWYALTQIKHDGNIVAESENDVDPADFGEGWDALVEAGAVSTELPSERMSEADALRARLAQIEAEEKEAKASERASKKKSEEVEEPVRLGGGT